MGEGACSVEEPIAPAMAMLLVTQALASRSTEQTIHAKIVGVSLPPQFATVRYRALVSN